MAHKFVYFLQKMRVFEAYKDTLASDLKLKIWLRVGDKVGELVG